MTTTDRVAVIGAGPAGSVAALVLARAGVAVDLVDPDDFPRDKACGDALLPESLTGLDELGLGHISASGRLVSLCKTVDFDGNDVEVSTRSQPPTRIVPRTRLDADLRRAAVDAGAVPVRARFVGFDPNGGPGRTAVLAPRPGSAVERHYAYVVGADGSRSRVAAEAGLLPPKSTDRAVSVRHYVRFDESPEPEVVTGRLTVGDTPRGPCYEWALPGDDDWWNIGVYGCDPNAAPGMSSRLDWFTHWFAQWSGAEVVEARKPMGAILRYDFSPDRTSRPGVAVVGDAAGLGDAASGDGIHRAIASGKLVAEIIAERGFGTPLADDIAAAMDAAFFFENRVHRLTACRIGGGLTTPVGPGHDGAKWLDRFAPGASVGHFDVVDHDGFRWSNRTTRGAWLLVVDVDAVGSDVVGFLAEAHTLLDDHDCRVVALTTEPSAYDAPRDRLPTVTIFADRDGPLHGGIAVVDPAGVTQALIGCGEPDVADPDEPPVTKTPAQLLDEVLVAVGSANHQVPTDRAHVGD